MQGWLLWRVWITPYTFRNRSVYSLVYTFLSLCFFTTTALFANIFTLEYQSINVLKFLQCRQHRKYLFENRLNCIIPRYLIKWSIYFSASFPFSQKKAVFAKYGNLTLNVLVVFFRVKPSANPLLFFRNLYVRWTLFYFFFFYFILLFSSSFF